MRTRVLRGYFQVIVIMLTMKKKKFIVILIGLLLSVIPTSVEGQCSQCNDATDCGEDKAEECPEPSVTHCFSIMVEGTTRWGCTDDDYKCKGTADNCKVCDDTDCIEIDTITCTVENDAAQEKTRLCLSEVFCIGTYDEDGNIDTLECSETECGDDDDCRSCEDSVCPSTIHNCYSCNLSDEGDCPQIVEDTKSINCAKTDVGCLTRIDESSGMITRKCMSSDEETECKTNFKVCKLCKDEAKCNIHVDRKCTTSEPYAIGPENCLNGICKAIYNDNGNIDSLECSNTDCDNDDCRSCEDSVCPSTIHNCYSCNLSDEGDCPQIVEDTKSINCAKTDVGCLTRIDESSGMITRKCMSSDEETECKTNFEVCKLCKDEAKCNIHVDRKCTTSEPYAIGPENCLNGICKAIYNDNGNIDSLECSNTDCDNDDCRSCEDSVCPSTIHNCYSCNLSDEGDCPQIVEDTKSINCAKTDVGCLTRIDESSGMITRKCMSSDEETECKTNFEVCKLCKDEAKCNIHVDRKCTTSEPYAIGPENCLNGICKAIYNDNGNIDSLECSNTDCDNDDCRSCEDSVCPSTIHNCYSCNLSDEGDCPQIVEDTKSINCAKTDVGCLTRIDESSGMITRKCMSSDEETECKTNFEVCKLCKDEAKCNIHVDRKCTTSEPSAIGPENCLNGICKAIYNDNGNIDSLECSNTDCDNDDCRSCEDSVCPSTIHNCYSCNLSDEGDCPQIVEDTKSINCAKTDVGCLTRIDESSGMITRKCMSSDEETECKTNFKVCKLCKDEAKCNIHVDRKCTTSEPYAIGPENCLNGICKAIYNDNGNIDSLECSNTDCDNDDCRSCEDSVCPSTIHNCYSCNLSDEGDCPQIVEDTKSINCAKTDVGCLTRIDESSGMITRKCMSSDEETECKTNFEVCKLCKDEAKCNIHVDRKCTTSEPSAIGPENCLNGICKAIYNDNGNIDSLECSNTDCDNDDCRSCEDSVCPSTIHNCYSCNLSDEGDCPQIVEDTKSINCAKTDVGCLTRINEGKITRKCMTETEETECFDSKICISCKDGEKCNIDETSICEAEGDFVDTVRCLEFNDRCNAFYNDDGKLYKMKCKSEMTEDCTTNDCQDCKGNVCQKEVLRCHACTSLDNELDCINHLGNIPSSNCAVNELLCFTRLEGDKVTRGCLQDVSQCNNRDVCRMCVNQNDCNNDAVTVCSAQNNVREALTDIVCSNFDDECQGIYNTDGELTELKCGSSGTCEDGCEFCEGFECKAKLLSCYTCDDSDEESDCFKEPSQTARKLCSISTTECFTNWEYENGILTRGCLDDASVCKNNADCKTCPDDNCNNLPKDKLTKYCTDENGDNQRCSKITDTCHGIYNAAGVLIEAGCKNDLEGECNSSLCRECGLDGCDRELRTCIRCGVDDINCTILPGRFTPIVCQSADSSCYVKQNEEGKNERGCFESGENCNTNCQTCSESNCNDKPFPESRRRCYACDGSRTCDEEMDTTEDDVDSLLKICEKTDDECVTRIIEASRTIRGCKGELDSQAENCPSNTCKVCAENGCNSEFAIKNPDLSCYVCNSTELGCGYALSKFIIKPRPCRGLVLMGNEEHCYHFKKDVIERGCALELNLSVDEYIDCAAGETCHLCTDNNCNDGLISEASLGVTNALYLVLITTVITYLT